MSMYIRHLPGEKSLLLSPEQYAPNCVFFNPSAAGPWIYLRATRHSASDEVNFAVLHNRDTKALRTIESPFDQLEPTANLFKGIEDLRIVEHPDGRIWFTATTTHASKCMNNEMILGCFDADMSRVQHTLRLDFGFRPIKNICPFVYKDELLLLDAYKMAIYKPPADISDKPELVKKLKTGAGVDFTGLRGSTSPVHLHGSTWGFVVHGIIFNDNLQLVMRLSYYHHWVEMDIERGQITYVSTPFWIAHWGIEYVSGLRYDRKAGLVELFFGVEDKKTMRCVTTLANLRCGK